MSRESARLEEDYGRRAWLYGAAIAAAALAATGSLLMGTRPVRERRRLGRESVTFPGSAPTSPDQTSKAERAGRWVTIAALASTGLTVVLAVIVMDPQPACGGSGSKEAPEWADAMIPFVSASAVAAIALNLAALLFRHWLAALVGFVVTTLIYIAMIGSTCALS